MIRCSLALGLLASMLVAARAPLSAAPPSSVLITAVYADPFVNGEGSEAVQVQNVSGAPLAIGAWKIQVGSNAVTFPGGVSLAAGAKIWAARSAAAFRQEFGSPPAFEYGGDSDASVPDLTGSAFALRNAGAAVLLKDEADRIVDAMVYGDASLGSADWEGAGVQPYLVGGNGSEGQILYRKRAEASGLPVPDTNSNADWAQDATDASAGKRVLYPGWDVDEFFYPFKTTERANLKFCVAPDNLYACVRDEIISARATISMEMYSLNNAFVVDAITSSIESGVQFSALLEGNALSNQGKWACQEIEARGGQCWIMASKPQEQTQKRYENLHAKALIIDRQRVLIGSENLDDDALPADDKRDGTFGTRGGFFISDGAALVAAAEQVLERDFDPARRADVRRWGTYADDFPPLGFKPQYANGGKGYTVRFPTPLTLNGSFSVELVQCPENCLRTSDALLGRLAQAGAGDTLLVEQLYEYPFWGPRASNAARDPNVRLEAYIGAARRGARVRILLDSFYDVFSDPSSNWAACAYVNQFAARYDIQCRLANPTGRGIHLKLVALKQPSGGWVHLGSINGSETSNKLNRELAVQVDSAEALAYWQSVFEADWGTTTLAPHREFLPLIGRRAQ